MKTPPAASPSFDGPLDATLHLADTTIVGIERLARLEMRLAWDWLALAREQASTPAPANGGSEADNWSALMQRGSQAMLRFNRTCLDTASLRQTELTRIATEQAAALQHSWLATASAASAASASVDARR